MILYLALAFAIFGCTNTGTNKTLKQFVGATLYPTKYPEIRKENSIHRLMTVLEESEYVYGKSYGFTGEESYVHDCYERLCRLASDSLLFQLTYDKNATMGMYAYQALLNTNKTLAGRAVKRLENDDAKVCLYSADVKMEAPVCYFVKNVFK